jgi:DNA-binding Lrp family transcriptional regulator
MTHRFKYKNCHNVFVKSEKESVGMSDKEKEKLKLLHELIRGARRSDRELAKVLKISQPTITRKRTRLEAEGLIQEYTIIPNVAKMGFEIVAFTFLSFNETTPELLEKAQEWSKKQPNIIFAGDGEGISMSSILISLHRNYASFSKLITNLRQDWQPNLKDVQSFILSLNRPDLTIKPFSFRYLEKADH